MIAKLRAGPLRPRSVPRAVQEPPGPPTETPWLPQTANRRPQSDPKPPKTANVDPKSGFRPPKSRAKKAQERPKTTKTSSRTSIFVLLLEDYTLF